MSFLSVKNISKFYGNLKANDDISIDFESGEVHVVLGENGAGKTTLMNIIFALVKPDDGEIILKGNKVDWNFPSDAIDVGIGMVHQHFKLVPNLTVAENIIMGTLKKQIIDYKKINLDVSRTCEQYGIALDPKNLIYNLSAGQKQQVEILKCLYREANLFILDEPTSVLTPQEAKGLFKTIKKLCADGRTVIMITHKMEEVMEVSDRITVLRNGRKVRTVNRKDTSIKELSQMMVGQDISYIKKDVTFLNESVVLQVNDLCLKEKDNSRYVLNNISFDVHEGEIFGIVGVSGNGQKELVEVISGLKKAPSGKVLLKGRDILNLPRYKVLDLGLAHIPESRQVGLAVDLSVIDNSILGKQTKEPFSQKSLIQVLNVHKIVEYIEKIIKDYNVKTKHYSDPAKYLSGGHQQRLILGREISKDPVLVIADKPTYGLDISAEAYVRAKLVEVCQNKGIAVLLIISELNMAYEICDRFMVMYCGRNMGIFKPNEINYEKVGLLMMGTPLEQADTRK